MGLDVGLVAATLFRNDIFTPTSISVIFGHNASTARPVKSWRYNDAIDPSSTMWILRANILPIFDWNEWYVFGKDRIGVSAVLLKGSSLGYRW